MGPNVKPELVYTDGSMEFKTAFETLGYSKEVSTPYRPETNGVAERAVRRVKEGTAAVLLQSGFHMSWWAEATETFCFLRNVTDKQNDGMTAYQKRFGEFPGLLVPFGAECSYMPHSPKDLGKCTNLKDKCARESSSDTANPKEENGTAITWWLTKKSLRKCTEKDKPPPMLTCEG